MADALDSGSNGRKTVQVQVLLSAPIKEANLDTLAIKIGVYFYKGITLLNKSSQKGILMKTVQYGEYTISVDIEKTAEYYRNYHVQQTQANRNFAKYCETLSDEEKEFFNSFAINPICCEIEHIGVSSKGNFPCGGFFLVCGEYLEFPHENLITVEDLAANDFVDDRPDPRINIGMFQFDFQCAEYEISDIPDDMPEGFICIRFWCENMKWLLDEKAEEQMYEPQHFWEIRRILQEKKDRIKQAKIDLNEANQEFCSTFDRLHIQFHALDKQEIRKYRKVWVRFYTPSKKIRKQVQELCLPSRKYTPFLWHIFSFEILPCKEKEEAEKAYELTEKRNCVLFDNIHHLAYRIENGDAITTNILKSFIDVTVTAEDFSWTYSKTHDEQCGPYFYKK